ncbi:unnamed protein product [Schistosoma margrebowiei]|uniref:DUF6451 domain-containing protein n=1 Tax=Schistosoma margrebowiei TaxID=48269 RepID=A0A183LMH2_9TREM|nr:unnamed protein product [Schistosoma margrebowiei]
MPLLITRATIYLGTRSARTVWETGRVFRSLLSVKPLMLVHIYFETILACSKNNTGIINHEDFNTSEEAWNTIHTLDIIGQLPSSITTNPYTETNACEDIQCNSELCNSIPHHSLVRSKIVKYNTDRLTQITLDIDALLVVKTFPYPVSIIDNKGGSDANVKELIDKAQVALLQSNDVWNSKQLSFNIKVRIFNIYIQAVLSYGTETCRTTTTIIKTVQVFINSCLFNILNVH